jgi:hypothetical protein
MKTSQPNSARAHLSPWPLGHPVLDGFLVALVGLALGPLHPPAQSVTLHPPHRRIGQRRPGQPLDHHREAVQGPYVGGEDVQLMGHLGAREQPWATSSAAPVRRP